MNSLCGILPPNTHMQTLMVLTGHRREVIRVYASAVQAGVMHLVSLWNGTIHTLPHRHMGKARSTPIHTVSVPIAEPLPDPASGVRINGIGVFHTKHCIVSKAKPLGATLYETAQWVGAIRKDSALTASTHAQTGRIGVTLEVHSDRLLDRLIGVPCLGAFQRRRGFLRASSIPEIRAVMGFLER